MFSLGEGDTARAASLFAKANSVSPNWVQSAKEYFATGDQFYWTKLFKTPDEFRKRYEEAFSTMEALPQPK